MDRKGIVAVALAIALLVYWNFENTKVMQRQLQEKQAAEAAEAAKAKEAAAANPSPAAAGTEGAVMASGPGATAPVPAPATPVVPEQLTNLDSPSVAYEFTNLGGGIHRARLKNHKAEHGSNVVINQFGSLPVGGLSEGSGGQGMLSFTQVEGAPKGQAIFQMTDQRQLQIQKTFTLPSATTLREEYLTTLEVSFTNKGAQPLPFGAYFVHTGSAAPIHKLDQAQYTGVAWLTEKFVFKNASAFRSGGFLGFGKQDAPVFSESRDHTRWAGVTNQYFSTIVTPLEAEGNGLWAQRFAVDQALIGTGGEPGAGTPIAVAPANASNAAAHAEAVEGALAMPGFTLAPGETKSQRFELYTGPREYQRLQSLGHSEEEIMDFGIFKIVSKTLLRTMNWLHSLAGSYAIAIIILTLIIRGLMWPLQNKATQSMKKMQALQPKIAELKTKYKDDPAKQQTEQMKLFKDYQINPAAGCLPMLVQIPVFFGFYSMLGKAVELRNARFLWVDDLSQMDTVAWIPLLEQPLNVLPLCMAGTMLWQMSLSPKTGDAVQQKIFMFMPLIFVSFCYKYASALALYWTVQNLFSVFQLYITRNQTAPVLQKVLSAGKKR